MPYDRCEFIKARCFACIIFYEFIHDFLCSYLREEVVVPFHFVIPFRSLLKAFGISVEEQIVFWFHKKVIVWMSYNVPYSQPDTRLNELIVGDVEFEEFFNIVLSAITRRAQVHPVRGPRASQAR
jgi:hypothetical protein